MNIIKTIFFLFFWVLAISLKAQPTIEFVSYIINQTDTIEIPPDETIYPVLRVDSLQEGEIYEIKILFVNSGNSLLRITGVSNVQGGPFTANSWSKEPVQPGKTGFVIARFDAYQRTGVINRTITVFTNSPNSREIYLNFKTRVYDRIISGQDD